MDSGLGDNMFTRCADHSSAGSLPLSATTGGTDTIVRSILHPRRESDKPMPGDTILRGYFLLTLYLSRREIHTNSPYSMLEGDIVSILEYWGHYNLQCRDGEQFHHNPLTDL